MTKQEPQTPTPNFAGFAKAVLDSVNGHARRKNYTVNGADDPNQLVNITKLLGINEQHAIAEIIYKASEFLKAPSSTKKILLEKIAGWAYMLWREVQ